ncbi:MAG: helix-turn-helix domain-containing protein [Oscillospiraceae bacterium]|nr:helix-turn-helix domain-containing protein [Oscillospiraceae bacterium]
MAKGKYQKWLEPEGLLLLEGWAREGLTDEQIARKCGCSVRTLYEWQEKHPQISQALKKGKEVVDFEVENELLKAARSGNVTAQIFWLKNRRPDKWREKPEREASAAQQAAASKLFEALEKEEP